MSIRSRFREGRGLLAWLFRNRRELGAGALRTFAEVRAARRGEDGATRAAEIAATLIDNRPPNRPPREPDE